MRPRSILGSQPCPILSHETEVDWIVGDGMLTLCGKIRAPIVANQPQALEFTDDAGEASPETPHCY